MAIELAEHDEQGTASNPRLWLEHAADFASKHGTHKLLDDAQRQITILTRMAEAGLGDYRDRSVMIQNAAISTAIETALLFMR